ncbi:MAG: hypothetical protein QW343_00795 [Candidatus Norongarragalinales archaeon]
MNFEALLGFAWRFARNRERVGLYTLFLLGSLAVLGLFFLLLFAVAGGAFGGALASSVFKQPNAFFTATAASAAVLILALFFVTVLVLAGVWLWIDAGIVKNAASEYSGERASLRECLAFTKTRFWTLAAVVILASVISFAASFLARLPFLAAPPSAASVLLASLFSFLASVIAALFLFFASYAVIVVGESVVASLSDSINLFLKNPIQVFLVALITLIAAIALFVVLLIPVAVLVFAAVFALALKGALGAALMALFLLVAALIFLVGFAFISVFLEGFKTAAFIELKELAKLAIAAPTPSLASPTTPRVAPRAAAPRKPRRAQSKRK